ncbi:hypothetical protein C7402_103140 [Paraburkholderia unamae]|uniref:Uncharacterized protein n=2 Tax=Paraburkholderia unamae TaxID=219649 RepID=A0ABX5KSF0_9BURK|nr:hypothetical protein C7402_103140 [Paraburkholderia unamae]RAR55228.1 hypothetical protein C7401_1223 [Paraburkholderia unamae]CAG9268120.1 hypothetical protein PUN4_550172 [Paraburkholderia unamae]
MKIGDPRPLICCMDHMTSTATAVVESTVYTIEILRDLFGIELEETAIDKLLCCAYFEHVTRCADLNP